jgi:hypothetical protein
MTCVETTSTARCVNEGCARFAELNERYCAPCGLERALFRRDARRPAAPKPARPGGEADRR